MDRDRLGTNTIRHNAQWAAILLPHPRGLWRLSGAQHIPAFLCSVAFSSACGEPVLTEAAGPLPRTSDTVQAADGRCSHQPCSLVEVLRLAISFGDRQTRNADRLASPAFQAVLEDEIAPGQTEATQKHPSTDCSNGGRKSNLGQGRVADELALKLGIRVSPRTVGAYWPNQPGSRGPSSQRWNRSEEQTSELQS